MTKKTFSSNKLKQKMPFKETYILAMLRRVAF